MAYLNPYYNSNAEANRRFHYGEWERCRVEWERLVINGAGDTAAGKAKELEMKHHQTALMATFRQQHKTVQDYATWVLRDFPLLIEIESEEIVFPDLKIENFETLEEVDKFWEHCCHLKRKYEFLCRANMKIGNSQKINAFDKNGSSTIEYVWCNFENDFDHDGNRGELTLATVEKTVAMWRVCFMQCGTRPISLYIDVLARIFYEKFCPPERHQRRAIWNRLKFGIGGEQKSPERPSLRVFQHVPPNFETNTEERFSEVLHWETHNPRWWSFGEIPPAVQAARFRCPSPALSLPLEGIASVVS
jgi:hypothetical protein